MSTSILIEGKISVQAALHSKYRKVHTIFYDVAKLERKKHKKRIKSLDQILEFGNSKKIKIEAVNKIWFKKNTKGKSHGGLAAIVSERTFQTIPELLKLKPCIVFFLDGIEDPYNLGYTIRSLYAAGIDGIILRQRRWIDADEIIIKSSAGTSELMPIVFVDDLETATAYFKSNYFKIICTDKDRGQSIYQCNLKPPLFIIIGGEKRGINSYLLDKADLFINIPYKRKFPGSLPISSAATIIGFETFRQGNHAQK